MGGKKRVTIQDIAQAASLSPASVSMILNRKSLPRFSEDSIRNVNRIAEELGYKTKSKRKKQEVLIICPTIMNAYYATLVQGMEMAAHAAGFSTRIATTYWFEERERQILESVDEERTAGVIFAMIPQNPEIAGKANQRIPMVAVGDRNNKLGINTVDIDNYSAGIMLAQHLTKLGHTQVAYITTTLDEVHSARVRRHDGLRKGIEQFSEKGKVTVYEKKIVPQAELTTPNIEYMAGNLLVRRCIHETPEVTALVAINDMVAYGVIDGLLELGKKIPADYSVCGFDNIYPSRFLSIQLTTVEHSIVQRGQHVFSMLLQKLNEEAGDTIKGVITRIEYESKIIPGKTTARPRTK